jgi:hypothetical protein
MSGYGLLILGVLAAVFADVVSLTSDPPLLSEIKRRYKIIQGGLPHEDRWKLICNKNAIITKNHPKVGEIFKNLRPSVQVG